jgi:transposase
MSSRRYFKGMPSFLGVGLRRKISCRFRVYEVNEAFTSKKCYACENDLQEVLGADGELIWAQKQCNTPGCSVSRQTEFSRDENGARNIRKVAKKILQDGKRPVAFTKDGQPKSS